MTQKYNNVYVSGTWTIAGVYEKNGPIANYFDEIYSKDFYYNEKSFEKAESKMLENSIKNLIKKDNISEEKIDLLILGDLLNQISASNYAAREFNIPYLGVYNACATSGEEIIIGSTFIDSKKANNIICGVSSNNMSAEKQFRNPTEYGAPKKKTVTWTVTGGTSIHLSSTKSPIRVESSTIGSAIDIGLTDVNNMGAIMAIAASKTLYNHLSNLNRDAKYYDLIVTGDLGEYGKKILIDYMKQEYNIDISTNYNDCGTMIYDTKKQNVFAGGSGPACSSLVMYSYIYKEMLNKKYKKVLYIPTGAIFSPTFVYQKNSIPSIAHAVSFEVCQ